MSKLVAADAISPISDSLLVDSRAPRFNQATVALGSLLALSTGAWPILTLLGVQLTVSVVFGRAYCLPCVLYFRLVQPRFGIGPLEDARAPRFANILGAIFLLAASAAFLLGFQTVGFALGALVAALATLAVTTGLCVGCEVYRLIARLRGIRGGTIDQIDLEQLGVPAGSEAVVLFTHPLCSGCDEAQSRLSNSARPLVIVDVSTRKELAKKYRVSVVPMAFSVLTDGRVVPA